jgi:hypothetical protein
MEFLLIFGFIFLLNLIPAFAPPTWMAVSYLGMKHPSMNALQLAVLGATAATLGRLALAKMARLLIRDKLLSEATRQNVDSLRGAIEGRRKFTFSLFLFYAFSPLPSNNLFLAYGLTTLGLPLIAIPFFLGRVVSYAAWFKTATVAAHRFKLTGLPGWMVVYFFVTQSLLLFLVYLFTRVDWRFLIEQKKFRWLPRRAQPPLPANQLK